MKTFFSAFHVRKCVIITSLMFGKSNKESWETWINVLNKTVLNLNLQFRRNSRNFQRNVFRGSEFSWFCTNWVNVATLSLCFEFTKPLTEWVSCHYDLWNDLKNSMQFHSIFIHFCKDFDPFFGFVPDLHIIFIVFQLLCCVFYQLYRKERRPKITWKVFLTS